MTTGFHKTELCKMVSARLGVPQADAKNATEAVLESIKTGLQENGQVTITGFGTFKVKDVPARKVRMIAGANKGDLIDVPANKRVAFTPGKPFTEAVRNGHGE